MNKIFIGAGQEPSYLYTNMLNRHLLIAGATGTGKTITLKVLAEKLSQLGIPSFMADIKGDLTSLAEAGMDNDKIQDRLTKINLTDWKPTNFPIELWDVYGEKGLPLRTTISDMGPILLSRILDLNDVQEGILNILFRVSDQAKLLLIDLKDLKAMLTYLEEHRQELQKEFGNISPQSIGAIRRAILVLENQGAELFFGEPELDIQDLITTKNGQGLINILSCEKLFQSPRLYCSFIFWLLTDLYENLPEVGDLDQPKIMFFFDEAHVLFDEHNKMLQEKVELIARLIRSKGVGVAFITQNPTDIPDSISSQIGNRIQHGMRAFSPKEKKVVKNIAELFPGGLPDLEDTILNLGVGEAVVSFLNEKSIPSDAQAITVAPPESKIGTVDSSVIEQVRTNSPLASKYAHSFDRYSAYEALAEKEAQNQTSPDTASRTSSQANPHGSSSTNQNETPQSNPSDQGEGGGLIDTILETVGSTVGSAMGGSSRSRNPVERIAGSMMNTIGRELGRQLIRGIFGNRRR